MTKKRNDGFSTEFGLWLRNEKFRYKMGPTVEGYSRVRQVDPIESRKNGYSTTNIDYLWKNYKTGKWMLIEEKRYMRGVEFSQKELFKTIDLACRNNSNYCGFHIIQFENTNPEDGKIYLDGSLITKEQLLDFLQFKPLTL